MNCHHEWSPRIASVVDLWYQMSLETQNDDDEATASHEAIAARYRAREQPGSSMWVWPRDLTSPVMAVRIDPTTTEASEYYQYLGVNEEGHTIARMLPDGTPMGDAEAMAARALAMLRAADSAVFAALHPDKRKPRDWWWEGGERDGVTCQEGKPAVDAGIA